ncbi:hypothetical protein BDZ91DRAFT_766778 [Kalaharituber pfeilii]|nr:hypothetical protein BDZ91DRAFT_766778 [Kalaharituber pfeilii]
MATARGQFMRGIFQGCFVCLLLYAQTLAGPEDRQKRKNLETVDKWDQRGAVRSGYKRTRIILDHDESLPTVSSGQLFNSSDAGPSSVAVNIWTQKLWLIYIWRPPRLT